MTIQQKYTAYLISKKRATISCNEGITVEKILVKNFFEKTAWEKNFLACGIDEVGRGCLCGPLVVAAVILPPRTKHKLLKDSKVLTEKQRNQAYEWIIEHCTHVCITVPPHTIDKKNIYHATRCAMKKAFLQILEITRFKRKASSIKYLITDAMPIKIDFSVSPTFEIHSPTKAESISPTVAAASIVAKVTRDRLMGRLSVIFPRFSLEKHKGYGTKTHINEIKMHGATIIHRKTFLKKVTTPCVSKNSLEWNDTTCVCSTYGRTRERQQSIC